MNLKTKIAALFMCISFSPVVVAQTADVDKKSVNLSPYFAKIGRTIFVSGPSSRWLGQLQSALPAIGNESAMRTYRGDPSKQVDLVVFVNATSSHPEKVGGAWFLIARMQGHGVSTKIVGECDMFCARLFIAGKTREFGQDLNGGASFLKIQVPIDFETKLIERRFPSTQIALYERLLPEFADKFRDLLVRGFTQPTDATGGVFIGAESVKYCATLKTGKCEDYAGLNAFSMGLTTSKERAQIVLPERFPAPVPTGYAAIDDLTKLPIKDEATISKYLKFLKSSNGENRAFAVSEDGMKGVSVGAWGTVDGEEAGGRALRLCEDQAKARCRLYASGGDIVW